MSIDTPFTNDLIKLDLIAMLIDMRVYSAQVALWLLEQK